MKNPKDLYRFGFNGQEKVNEIFGRGTHYDFGARYHDARIGRLGWAADPKAYSFPALTPYAFAANSPIAMIDKDGGFTWDPNRMKDYPMTVLILENADKLYFNKELPTELQEKLNGVDL